MIRAVVVADSGRALARMTEAVEAQDAVEIARYAHGRGSIEALLRALKPDLVFIDVRWPALALARVVEGRRGAPDAAVVVLAAWPKADWLADALRLGAAAVLPANVEPRTLHQVIEEVRAAPLHKPATVHELVPHSSRRRRTTFPAFGTPTTGSAA
jgi:DNA-binding NarL/FixJ family response regulator